MYKKLYEVYRFNTNQNEELHLSTLLHYLNEIMEFNAESYGAGADYHLKQDLAWVLTQYDLVIHRLPKAGERVYVGTLPYAFKRMVGYRVYSIEDELGNVLVEGKGKFLLINIKTKEMVRPSQEMLDLFKDAKKEAVALPFNKWQVPNIDLLHSVSFPITQPMIDANRHLNNAYFVALAYEGMPKQLAEAYSFSALDVVYKKEAFYGDEVKVLYHHEKDVLYATMKRDDEVLSEVRFKLLKR